MEVAVDAGHQSGTRAPEQQVRVTRKSLQAVLEQCQKALVLLNNADLETVVEDGGDGEECSSLAPLEDGDSEADQLCNRLKSRVESPNFLEKLGSIHMSVSQNNSGDENTSWDMITATDLWEDQDGYVLVDQEDIVDGIACFMATYLLSLKQTKDLNPNQLQEALSKTFSVKKKKGKLRKAWDGSKVLYNVASWGATAIGIYQNPALIEAASAAFWTSCRVISKLF